MGWSGVAAVLIVASMLAGSASAQSSSASPTPAGENNATVPAAQLDTRTIHLRHQWTRHELKVAYKVNGAYQPEAMGQINHLLRDWRCDKTIEIDPKLVDLLYELHQALGAQNPIHIVSAYRSEGYNASLLRAGRNVDPNSQHMLGHAVDIIIPGIRGAAVRDMALKLSRGGVGYYAYSWPNFVHVDTGPVRRWIEVNPKAPTATALPAQHRRFKLDCNLTMDEVLAEIPRERVLAALPAGASVETMQPAYGTTTSGADATESPPEPSAERVAVNSCMAGEVLEPLAKLSRNAKAFATRAMRRRLAMHLARHHHRLRHRSYRRHARRGR